MEIDDDVIAARTKALLLMDEVKEIEAKLTEFKGVLDTNRVGLTGPLVDQEGFPRNDIDVYQVRHARHQIICLQNDHKALLARIEACIHQVHLEDRENQTVRQPDPLPRKNLVPIAVVDSIAPGSPAASSGLEQQDHIVQFGTVSYKNFSSLQDIGSVVKSSVDQKVSVLVLRSGAIKSLSLTPKTWAGRGLLGCNILPIESIDR